MQCIDPFACRVPVEGLGVARSSPVASRYNEITAAADRGALRPLSVRGLLCPRPDERGCNVAFRGLAGIAVPEIGPPTTRIYPKLSRLLGTFEPTPACLIDLHFAAGNGPSPRSGSQTPSLSAGVISGGLTSPGRPRIHGHRLGRAWPPPSQSVWCRPRASRRPALPRSSMSLLTRASSLPHLGAQCPQDGPTRRRLRERGIE